jgi:hypothetical protein
MVSTSNIAVAKCIQLPRFYQERTEDSEKKESNEIPKDISVAKLHTYSAIYSLHTQGAIDCVGQYLPSKTANKIQLSSSSQNSNFICQQAIITQTQKQNLYPYQHDSVHL